MTLVRISKKASDDALATFGKAILQGLEEAGFGSQSKSEIELLIFRSLVIAEILSLDKSNFDLARQLQVPLTKVQSLKFALRIRTPATDEDALLREGVYFVHKSSNSTTLVFSIEDRFTRELAIARLKQVGAFADSSFNRERLIVATDDFDLFVDVLFPTDAVELKSAVNKIRRAEKLGTAADAVLSVLKSASGSFAIALVKATTGI